MQKNKRVKRILVAVSILIVLAAALAGSYLMSVYRYKESVSNMTFSNIDLHSISDGTYVGECDVDFIYAKVSVTVLNGTITHLELLEHRNDRGTPAEAVINAILEKQTIDVDSVSGATNSSLVIKKAVENALLG